MSYRPEVLVLHDADHGNFSDLTPQIPNLPVGHHIYSFTDTEPRVNSRNTDLSSVAFRNADYVLLQSRLLRPLTVAAGLVISSSVLSSVKRTEFFEFSDDYELSGMSTEDVFDLMVQSGEQQ